MQCSQSLTLIAEPSALQHERSPRPLPLFLELVRMVARDEPDTARAALDGLRLYEQSERPPRRKPAPEIARVGGACLRDHGGDGPPVVLVPSLINPPGILDLDPESSLATAIAAMGRRALLLDWGAARDRSALSVAGHVTDLLCPLIEATGEPPALVGYCLGGTTAIAAANLVPVERVVTLAAPWHFSNYPLASRSALQRMWADAQAPAERLGVLPMEVLQAAFWSLDPHRTVGKFADFSRLDPHGDKAARFIQLEDWANDGEPLPAPAARELIEDLFGADVPGRAEWLVGARPVSERIGAPVLHCTASRDAIAPAATAAEGPTQRLDAGHVGMIVGSARHALHALLRDFLDPLAARRAQG